jgi:phospho-N-acetylmuramoyl-pentapeptide-transferase
MILAAIVVSTLIWNDLRSPYAWIGLLVLGVLGVAGFVDDYIKLKHKPSRGLTKTQKLVIQFILGGVVGCLFIHQFGVAAERISLTYRGPHWDIGWWYVPWCGFLVAATSNAVNLTDGLDGLAGGLSLFAALMMALIGLGAGYVSASLLTAAIAGGVLAFLWYNCHPARIFMGDTGSLALGGLLAYVALALQCEFILLIVGAVFFIEELTVAMQIVGFKLTKKRIFPITPIHHYFQVNLKWPEQKIVTRAWILGLAAAALGWAVEKAF